MNVRSGTDRTFLLPAGSCRRRRSPLAVRATLRHALTGGLLLATPWLFAQSNAPATPATSPAGTPKQAAQVGAAPPQTAGLTAADTAGVEAGSLIMLPFFVLAKNEQPVPNLPPDGVTVQQDGHPETIQKLLHAGDQPLVLSLLVDTRANDNGILEKGRVPLEKFTDSAMTRPADRAAVIDFNDDAGLDLALTTSREKAARLA